MVNEVRGLILVVALWAGLVAWIAKVAQARGRSVIGWPLLGGAAGAAGFALGVVLFANTAETDLSTLIMLLSTLAPLVLMVAAMAGVVYALHRAPVHVANAKDWAVHFVDRGAGQIRFHGGGKVTFEWPNGSRDAELRDVRAQPDGESVRVQIDGDELCLMPLGKPDTPAGRRQQSVHLARMLGRSASQSQSHSR
jgi:hypothetical protein